jgi:predicted MFS family arabinose efflux permease
MMNGFGFGIVNPTIQAFVLRSAPYSRRGAASGTYYSANDLGNGVGSILGGVLAQTIGFTLTFGLYAIFVVGAFAVFFFILRKKITPADCG